MSHTATRLLFYKPLIFSRPETAGWVQAVISLRDPNRPDEFNFSVRAAERDANLAELAAQIDFEPKLLASPLGLPHSSGLRPVLGPGDITPCPKQPFDGLYTVGASDRLALEVRSADCPVVLLANPATHQVAAIHAGWRGVAGGILRGTLLDFCPLDQRGQLLAYIGPGAKSCCYEVTLEFLDHYPSDEWPHFRSHLRQRGKQFFFDLQDLVIEELILAGIRRSNIEAHTPGCSICNPQYHSNRRQIAIAQPGGLRQMAALIGRFN